MCSPQTLRLSLSSPPLPDVVLHLKGIHHHMFCHVIGHACICSPPTTVLPTQSPACKLTLNVTKPRLFTHLAAKLFATSSTIGLRIAKLKYTELI